MCRPLLFSTLQAERAPTGKPRWTLKEAPRASEMLDSIRDRK